MAVLEPFVTSLPIAVLFVLVATAVIWVASGWLERSAEALSLYYGLPAVVHGAVVVAIGSSFPELSSAVIATWLHGEFGLGVGAIVGSAIFNVLVIPAVSSLSTTSPVEANRDIVYKEAQFYMVAVAVLLITFSLAVIYYPVDQPSLRGVVTPALAAVPLALYGLYIFIQYQDTAEHEPVMDPPAMNVRRQWLLLAASLVAIGVAVEALVSGVLFTTAAYTPGLGWVWGITLIAAATSLPDALVSVRAARAGHSELSLANVLGSNVFDLLVAVPAGILVAALVGDAVVVDFGVAVPMMTALTIATIALFTVLRTDLHLTDLESYVLLGIYGLFLLWLVLGIFGLSPLPVPKAS